MIIKTIQWNIGGGLTSDKFSDRSLDESYSYDGLGEIVDILKNENPDIITLQEVHDGKISQAKYITDGLGITYFVVDHYDKSHLLEGAWLSQAIVSRFPIVEHDFTLFPNPKVMVKFGKNKSGLSHDKGMTTVTIKMDTVDLTVKTFHMLPYRRTGFLPTDPQFHNLRKDLNKKLEAKTEHLLIQGDFNFDSKSVEDFIVSVSDRKISEIMQENPTTPEGQRYDHVLYKGIKNISTKVNDKVMTDHFPIISEFLIK